jgi:predicted nucleic acid-binding protein
MYLLDTVVVSEMRKHRRDPNVAGWLGSVAATEVYLSVFTVVEIEAGIERQRIIDPAFATALSAWLAIVLQVYGDRILPLTVPIGRRWGRLIARAGNRSLDLAIAATALEHGLTVVTRNVDDFVPAGVATLNPFRPRTRHRS